MTKGSYLIYHDYGVAVELFCILTEMCYTPEGRSICAPYSHGFHWRWGLVFI